MKPITCPSCQSNDLAYARLIDHGGLMFWLSLFKWVKVSGATCLACGAVLPYLDDAALTKVQAWNRKQIEDKNGLTDR